MRSRNEHVQLWLNRKEAATLARRAKACGITQSAYLRHLIMGFVPREQPSPDYYAFMRSLYSLAMLAMVDEGKIAFNPAVELSYLAQERQRDLLAAIQLYDCTPSLAQAVRMKRASQENRLDAAAIDAVMKDEKANQKERLKIPVERIRRFFPASYTNAQMEEEIVKMCEARYRRRAAMER